MFPGLEVVHPEHQEGQGPAEADGVDNPGSRDTVVEMGDPGLNLVAAIVTDRHDGGLVQQGCVRSCRLQGGVLKCWWGVFEGGLEIMSCGWDILERGLRILPCGCAILRERLTVLGWRLSVLCVGMSHG